MKKKLIYSSIIFLLLLITDGKTYTVLLLLTVFGVAYYILHKMVERISWPEDTSFTNNESEPENID
jgi:hypothetical protein